MQGALSDVAQGIVIVHDGAGSDISSTDVRQAIAQVHLYDGLLCFCQLFGRALCMGVSVQRSCAKCCDEQTLIYAAGSQAWCASLVQACTCMLLEVLYTQFIMIA